MKEIILKKHEWREELVNASVDDAWKSFGKIMELQTELNIPMTGQISCRDFSENSKS